MAKEDRPRAAGPRDLPDALSDAGIGQQSDPEFFSQVISGIKVTISQPSRAVIVDSDVTICNLISNYLRQLGTTDIAVFHDGESAWREIRSKPYGIVAMEWRTKDSDSICLYNRIRLARQTATLPILVLTGMTHKANFGLLEESKCSKIIEKPFRIKDFDARLKEVLRSSLVNEHIEERITNALMPAIGDEKAVSAVIEDILRNLPEGFDVLLAVGKYTIGRRFYSAGERIFQIALKLDANSAQALTGLSRVYHATDRQEDAVKLLSKADGIAPGSMDRLCLLGEVNLVLQKVDDAGACFRKAAGIDRLNEKAAAGLIVATNLKEFLERKPGGRQSGMKLAGLLNLVGVALVRGKQVKKSIEQYQASLMFIPGAEDAARIQFNLGLACLRLGDKSQALHWMKISEVSDPSYPKPSEMIKRIEEAASRDAMDALLRSSVEDVLELAGSSADPADFSVLERQHLAKLNKRLK